MIAGILCAASAQLAFRSGLQMLYAYNHPAAIREFNSALRRDPHCAVAEAGIALADGTDLNTPLDPARFARAHDAARAAVALERYAAPEERALIEAVSTRYANDWDAHGADEDRYREAMASIVASHPQDDDAAMLYAEALMEAHGTSGLWKPNGTAATTDTQTILGLIHVVLERDPQHKMANHLCIHLYDFARDRSRALPCADRLAAMPLPFDAEHLAHMPAHAYIETGEYAKAIAASERAWQMAPTKYRPHDAYVGWNAAMMLGDEALAQKWGARFAQAGGVSVELTTLARFGRWNAITAAESHADLYRPFALGCAYAHLGDVAGAKEELALLTAGAGTDLREMLAAQIAERNGDVSAAQAALERAIAFQTVTDTAELLPLFPAGEALGSLYLRHGRLTDARRAFSQALALYPDDPRALYGLAVTVKQLGDSARAQQIMRAFTAQWSSAEPPELQDL